jgi:hypothetical protein
MFVILIKKDNNTKFLNILKTVPYADYKLYGDYVGKAVDLQKTRVYLTRGNASNSLNYFLREIQKRRDKSQLLSIDIVKNDVEIVEVELKVK